MNCPNGHGTMPVKTINKEVLFREITVSVPVKQHVCPRCGLEAGTVQETAETQRTVSEAYRKAVGLLTGADIVRFRKKMHLTQPQLAEKTGVGVASIKRWEGGLIQTKSMDKALRNVFWGTAKEDTYTGNRTFFIPRVKLVLVSYENLFNKKLLKPENKMLFSAKYLWYTDMVAYRENGQSMTGATYAALPLGPQLNNYRDLIKDIIAADITSAEPLTSEEQKTIAKITKAFPRKWDVYNAAHREVIWQRRAVGEVIPYSDAGQLTQI